MVEHNKDTAEGNECVIPQRMWYQEESSLKSKISKHADSIPDNIKSFWTYRN